METAYEQEGSDIMNMFCENVMEAPQCQNFTFITYSFNKLLIKEITLIYNFDFSVVIFNFQVFS